MLRSLRGPWVALCLVAAACGSGASVSTGDQTSPTGGDSTAAPGETKPFVNPGGMWMPSQIPSHADTLKRLGLEIDPKLLADPASPLLQGVVSLGGCSASFVSPEGLIITNHHCVQGALQFHSTPEKNLVETGYLARTRAEEKWNGPAARVFVTQKISDVTERMTTGLESITDDKHRHDEIENREKTVTAECEKGRPHMRCRVANYFQGAQWMLIESLEIRDVRLVYAPHSGIGWFGGDEDNWMWPRHTGDFSFYRAYVGPDGMPADYADQNVPFKSEHHLKLASKPLREGDLVMVAGYPGSTQRLKTAAEVEEAVSWEYPAAIARYTEYVAALREVGARDKDAAVKAQPMIFGFENVLKKDRGLVDGLARGGMAADKKKAQDKLVAWIDGDAGRKQEWGDLVDRMAAVDAERRATRDRDAAFGELKLSRLLGVAMLVNRMAEERAKPDADRDPAYQERNWRRTEAGLKELGRRYNRALDMRLLELALERGARDLAHNRDWLALILDRKALAAAEKGDKDALRGAIARTVARLYKGTRLDREDVRVKLWQKGTPAQMQKSGDAMVRLAVALRPLDQQIEDNQERLSGAQSLVRPRYMAALRAFTQGEIAPDANGTLRITFGTVRGYRPKPDADMYRPFTVLSEVVAKDRNSPPFDAPDALVAASKKDAGPYKDEKLGEVPVDFLSDVDTTGGNSGSATLNGRGELCGLLFDGTYESMAKDWFFIPEQNRSIHVDIRYAGWVMDAVEGADHLLGEMGLTPSL